MGAAIVRGRDIALQTSRSHDGSEFLELVPVEGTFEGASYSSVALVIKLCEERGVPVDQWPIYYGFDDIEVPLNEVRRKCAALRGEFVKLRPEDLAQHWFLQRVSNWLAAGEIFCVME
jgi:hypothetical protein